jgi:hypothetical protein
MKRQARDVPFARRRLDSVIQNLAAAPVAEWSKHSRLALNILTDELALDEETARGALVASSCVGHKCAQEIDQRSREIVDFAQRQKLRKIFSRIAKCARRSPAPLRRILDSHIGPAIDNTIVDTETVERLIQALVEVFARFPKAPVSLTVLRALTPNLSRIKGANFDGRSGSYWRFAEASVLLQQDYSALRAIDQRKIESALTALRDSRKREFHAAKVCEVIADALNGDNGGKRTIRDLVICYVVAVGQIWLQQGLKPARATHPDNHNYRGKFHRFADLVLTGAVEPWSKRHDDDKEKLLTTLRKTHAQLPADVRRFVRPAPRRADVEWLVSDDHLRAALARLKK